MLQRDIVCCSVLQCCSAMRRVLQHGTVCFSLLQCHAAPQLRCDAAWYSMLQCLAVPCSSTIANMYCSALPCIAACYSVWQCVAACAAKHPRITGLVGGKIVWRVPENTIMTLLTTS